MLNKNIANSFLFRKLLNLPFAIIYLIFNIIKGRRSYESTINQTSSKNMTIFFIEEKRPNETGNLLIYLHYFILFGLSLITVSLKFISEENANSIFAISCLYGGMFLFYIGLTIAVRYNKPQYNSINKLNLFSWIITLVMGYVISLLMPQLFVIACITAIISLFNAGMKVRLLYKY